MGLRRAVIAASALAVAVTAGCSAGAGAPVVTVTVTPAQQSTAAAPKPSPVQTRITGGCDTLLPAWDVEAALGHAVGSRSAFVVGVPERNIGRLAYLNCRYGMAAGAPGSPPQPAVEIGVSLYRTAAQAQERARATVFDYLGNDAQRSTLLVGGRPAVLLSGGTGSGYDVPLLVVVDGQRTIAVSVAPRAASGSARDAAMTRIAELALNRTAS